MVNKILSLSLSELQFTFCSAPTQTRLCFEVTQRRFQQLYEAAERREAGVEKRQLALLQQQRVQAEMADDRKRRLLQNYVEAVDTGDDQSPAVDVSALAVPVAVPRCSRINQVNVRIGGGRGQWLGRVRSTSL